MLSSNPMENDLEDGDEKDKDRILHRCGLRSFEGLSELALRVAV